MPALPLLSAKVGTRTSAYIWVGAYATKAAKPDMRRYLSALRKRDPAATYGPDVNVQAQIGDKGVVAEVCLAADCPAATRGRFVVTVLPAGG